MEYFKSKRDGGTKLFKRMGQAACLLAAGSLAGCATVSGGGNVSPVSLVLGVEAFAKQVSDGIVATDAALVPAACGLAGTMYTFAETMVSSGGINASSQLSHNIADIGAIYNSSICSDALAGKPVGNAIQIISEVASLVLTIASNSNGVITASRAVTTPATVALRRHLNTKIRHAG